VCVCVCVCVCVRVFCVCVCTRVSVQQSVYDFVAHGFFAFTRSFKNIFKYFIQLHWHKDRLNLGLINV
jgi:hypothetical protein